MSLKAIDLAEISPILATLEEAFEACQIDYYLIGALARDIWYANAEKKFTTTKDIDFAIQVGSPEEYAHVRNYLEEKRRYKPSKNNAFVIFAPDGTAVDLLPFGYIEVDEGLVLKGKGLPHVKLDGFKEVYEGGTEPVELLAGHSFQVATLSAIVLLKLIAYDDRPENRIKDAGDIAHILTNYFDMQAPAIYEHHNDLFRAGQPDRDLEEIASIVVGREIRRMLAANQLLHERTCTILQTLTQKKERSAFVRQMVQATQTDVDKMVGLLRCVHFGLITLEQGN